jgi:hypothetical protein
MQTIYFTVLPSCTSNSFQTSAKQLNVRGFTPLPISLNFFYTSPSFNVLKSVVKPTSN